LRNPLTAFAAPGGAKRPPAAAADKDDAYPDEPSAEQRPERRFPMESKRFLELVDKRLKRIEQRIDEKLKEHKLPAELEREIRAELARAEAQVREAARKAAADGKVTRDELGTCVSWASSCASRHAPSSAQGARCAPQQARRPRAGLSSTCAGMLPDAAIAAQPGHRVAPTLLR